MNALTTLTNKLATTLDMGDGTGLLDTLKATAFKGQVSDAQMTALLVVANQYGLNPWTKEIYAFPDKNNGIVPVVGVDGWSRIINNHPQFDGMEFQQDDHGCTCIIYRKDRSHPIKVTEWMAECRRNGIGPWQSHPKRMLRHKAMIQCARLAFGYGGIYDQDEAERIVDTKHMGMAEVVDPPAPPAPPVWPDDKFNEQFPRWKKAVEAKLKTPADITALAKSKGELTPAQQAQIDALGAPADEVVMTYAQVADRLNKAENLDKLAEAASLIQTVADEKHRKELSDLYDRRADELNPV